MKIAPVAAALIAACSAAPPNPSQAPAPAAPDADGAKAFVAKTNDDLKRLAIRQSTAAWIKNTYITDDTERMSAQADEEQLGYLSYAIHDAARFKDVRVDPQTSRMLYLLRVSSPIAAPADPARRLELTTLGSKLEGIYGKGKWCGADGKQPCRDLEDLTVLMGKSRDPAQLLDAWAGWHTISREMRPLYTRYVELANEGAREIGFANMGDLWRSGYDMPPAEFEKETDRLWAQVKPLYDQLHCYVRARLQKQYGTRVVPDGAPIPAHLLGNMWAQDWTKIYPIVEPYPGAAPLDVTGAMVAQGWDWRRMVKTAEAFFVSLGLDPLPQSFWERSLFVKPRDREVVCHASAWDVQYDDDLRIKMCIKVDEEDLGVLHHELGHDYYFHAYYKLPYLFAQGANEGFHEAIGDALRLSVTPSYLKNLGLIQQVPADRRGLINVQLKDALGGVAFLPFGKLIDQWRWDVFSGKISPSDYDKTWWELRRKYQGVAPPVERTEKDFDPGAKYHVAANVPYTRYFLASILHFQFHRALCKAAGFRGPLHECSIHGSKEAGRRLWAMLSLGASKPWPDALEALTGQRQMDATALLEYFAPLQTWLAEQNAGRRCGW
jgi:peptidyl-dipeptidase A